jgi:membrane associated rhomboid family serine protease
MTGALIVANAAAFLYQLSLGPGEEQPLFFHFGLVPARFTEPEWAGGGGHGASLLPFLTSMFLHGGVMHLVGNMWFMWIFADNVEDRMGPFRFLLFYLVCGVGAAGAHLALNLHSRVPTIGASGAIAGVLGAYFLMYPGSRVLTLVPLGFFTRIMEIPAFAFLGIWAGLQFLFGLLAASGPHATGVAFWAHVGGFVAGMLLFPLFLRPRARASR